MGAGEGVEVESRALVVGESHVGALDDLGDLGELRIVQAHHRLVRTQEVAGGEEAETVGDGRLGQIDIVRLGDRRAQAVGSKRAGLARAELGAGAYGKGEGRGGGEEEGAGHVHQPAIRMTPTPFSIFMSVP
jgi:hypothetical protein